MAPALARQTAASPPRRRNIRLMIVDDSMVARAVLTRMVELGGGIEISAVAGTAEDAVDALGHVSVDVILLDLEMPGAGGLSKLPEIIAAARGARVFAIEGDPRVFACLSRNIAGTPGITAENALIWKTEEPLTFYSEPRKADSSIFKPISDETVQAITLPATTLDRLAERHGIDRVDLLKCDAEGAEPEVIEGGRALLARTRQVAFDTGAERMGQETSDDVERLLKDLGFTVSHEIRRRRKITFGIRAA